MQHSRSRSPISLRGVGLLGAALTAALPAAGCGGDDACGPGGAPAAGLIAGSDQVTVTYGGLTSLLGNDCPDPAAPEGVISLSIEGVQTDGEQTGRVTLCVPRPDLLLEGERTLGTAASNADVRVIDLNGAAAGCTLALDTSRIPTGGVTAEGVCDGGDSPAGFALAFDAALAFRRTCGPDIDTVGVTLRGRVAVARR